jgi:putative membrane protein (TIGR04086 family)
MVNQVLVRPAATSWMSVLGGWIATIGAAALVAPAVAAIVGQSPVNPNDIAPAVPVVIGIFIAYLIGGYVAGRMAGYRTSWHGMMTAFFSLLVLLVVALLGYAADRGIFAASGVNSLADLVPGARGLNVDSIGNALTFGALLGFLAAIFAGWLGGVLAPSHAVVPTIPAVAPTPVSTGPVVARPIERVHKREREVVREGPRQRWLPAFGRKGGERVAQEERVADKGEQVSRERTTEAEDTRVERS